MVSVREAQQIGVAMKALSNVIPWDTTNCCKLGIYNGLSNSKSWSSVRRKIKFGRLVEKEEHFWRSVATNGKSKGTNIFKGYEESKKDQSLFCPT